MSGSQPYDLEKDAFAATPDSAFAWLDGQLGDLLAYFLGQSQTGKSGVTLVTGFGGSGKTLLATCLCERLQDNDKHVAYVNVGTSGLIGMLETICHQLGIDIEQIAKHSDKALLDVINAFVLDLYTKRKHVTILIDNAQDLPNDALLTLNSLAPMQASTPRQLHMILLATPVLRDRLHHEAVQSVKNAIDRRIELAALSTRQTASYIQYRMRMAGSKRKLFSRQAMQHIHHASGGVPALINQMAGRSLVLGMALERSRIDEKTVREAAQEVMPTRISYWIMQHTRWIMAALILVGMVAIVGWWSHYHTEGTLGINSLAAKGETTGEQVAKLDSVLPTEGASIADTWSELLARWQVSSKDISVQQAARCEAVIFPGFNCVGGTASIDQLARFNRPLVLNLELDGKPRSVVLLGVGPTRVRMFASAQTIELSRAALKQVWQGHFYAPYRLPEDLPSALRPGDKGEPVAWLDAKLRHAEGDDKHADRGEVVYDDAMIARVKNLQRRFGIPTDGVAGSETLFALMSLDEKGPHLQQNVH